MWPNHPKPSWRRRGHGGSFWGNYWEPGEMPGLLQCLSGGSGFALHLQTHGLANPVAVYSLSDAPEPTRPVERGIDK